MKITTIKKHLRMLEKRYGGVRPACRALKVDAAYWVRIRESEKKNPGAYVLWRLGLRRRVVYEVR